MINPEKNLIQSVRLVTIAVVTLIGLCTIAMKPAAASFDHQYGVVESADGTQWQIVADITDPTSDYECRADITACTIGSNSALNPGDAVPKDETIVLMQGKFIPF